MYIYIYIYIYMYICIMCIHVCVHIYIHMHICICVCVYVHVGILRDKNELRDNAHIYVDVLIHLYIYRTYHEVLPWPAPGYREAILRQGRRL